MTKKISYILIPAMIVAVAAVATYIYWPKNNQAEPVIPAKTAANEPPTSEPAITAPYIGKAVALENGFTVKVPNGWRASVSSQPSFLGMQFARPGQIESLIYNADSDAIVDYNGIPAWSGLTEHFYIRRITSQSQAFVPSRHHHVTTEPFVFDDGTTGTIYNVTKGQPEAAQWGGLLKDTEWYGRVFVYKKDGNTVEAHLAFYPSTKIDQNFYTEVAKSIKL